MTKKTTIRLLATLAILAAAAWVIVYLARPVAIVAPVTSEPATDLVPGSITVRAEFQMDIKSEIGGRIVKCDLDPGKRVHQGDFLAQIDSGDLELEIQQIQSDYDALKKRIAVGSQIALELATARDELVNKERLFKIGNLAEADYTKQVRLVKQDEQKLALEDVENKQKAETYENTLKVKRRLLQKMTITAPFDGVIASTTTVHPGQLIASDAPIASLISTSRTVEAKISEENFAGLRDGQHASVRFLGYGAQTFPATVSKILPTADPETQRYLVYLAVDIPPEKLVPGLTGEVSIVIGERNAKAVIPRRAVHANQVYVVRDGRIEIRDVKLGYVSLNKVEILEGLQPGEKVVVQDFDKFRAGDRVRAHSLN